MFVTAIAMNEGFLGARRAGRFFENGAEVRLEVLDQKDDPPLVKSTDGKTMVADPEKIGERTYEALKKDPRIKLLADGETVARHSRAAYEEAKRAAEQAAVEIVGLKLDLSRLRDENEQLKAAAAARATTQASEPAKGDDPGKTEPEPPQGHGKRR